MLEKFNASLAGHKGQQGLFQVGQCPKNALNNKSWFDKQSFVYLFLV